MAVLCVVPCSLVEVYRRFKDACCLYNQGLTAFMIEAASTSETLVNYQTTQRKNPEDSHLHARRHENLKSHYLNFDTGSKVLLAVSVLLFSHPCW
jgi:hypothetical protein